jgi:hypothetical protein
MERWRTFSSARSTTSHPRFAVRQRFHTFRIGRVPEVIGERDERFDGGRGARRGDVLVIIEDRAVGRHEAGLEPFGRAAEGNQAVGNLFGERAGLGALACHVDWHVDRTIGQPAVGREDLGETAVDVGNVAAQQCLNLCNMRAHAREAQGLLAHPRTASKMPTDIFPEIDIPVVTVIWQYTGLSTPEMEQRSQSLAEASRWTRGFELE